MKQIITGQTGSGKTYHSINKAKENGKFIYVAPCRQLVYETLLKYGGLGDSFVTGEVHEMNTGDCYAVYEALNQIELKDFKTLIIDEAHFLTDDSRNEELLKAINEYNGNLLLCTATDNFSEVNELVESFEKIELPSRVHFIKKEINETEFFKRVKEGEPSIYFHKFEIKCGMYGGERITGQTSCEERLKLQLAFERGDITFIECTNVLAQGVNFPATNVLIEYNKHDTNELVLQKLGRLGRMGFGHTEDTVMTYCCIHDVENIRINKKSIPKPKKAVDMTKSIIYGLQHRNILKKDLVNELKLLKKHNVLNFYNPYLDVYNIKTVELLLKYGVDIEKVFGLKFKKKYYELLKSRKNLKEMIKQELINK